ncbi:MAG TPA: RluA family pseudouridine synthase [Alphaproteobacteria bacterium]|nr:RluA family pseudouridine synthase [Alphaproteobacteria bacterium]
MAETRIYQISAEEAGLRLDRWFHRHFPDVGHGPLEKLLRTGQIRVDGGRVKSGFRLDTGHQVRVPPAVVNAIPSERTNRRQEHKVRDEDRDMLRQAVLHIDESLIVVNKPFGLAVQGGSRTERHLDGMLDALRFGKPERPRLVHRLDRDTSGVLLLGRTARATASLARSFQGRTAKKTYWALCLGVPRPLNGHIRAPLAKLASGRSGRERVRAVDRTDPRGQRAETVYHVVEKAGQSAAWLALMPLTGRTHQLRAHMALMETPIVGDRKYGGAEAFLTDLEDKLHLHARAISLPHPEGGQLEVVAPLPPHMRAAWDYFGFDADWREDPFAEWSA